MQCLWERIGFHWTVDEKSGFEQLEQSKNLLKTKDIIKDCFKILSNTRILILIKLS